MAEYQNLFTRVQVDAPHYPGVPHDPRGIWQRGVKASANYWLGKDRKSTRLNSSHVSESRMPSSA